MAMGDFDLGKEVGFMASYVGKVKGEKQFFRVIITLSIKTFSNFCENVFLSKKNAFKRFYSASICAFMASSCSFAYRYSFRASRY